MSVFYCSEFDSVTLERTVFLANPLPRMCVHSFLHRRLTWSGGGLGRGGANLCACNILSTWVGGFLLVFSRTLFGVNRVLIQMNCVAQKTRRKEEK